MILYIILDGVQMANKKNKVERKPVLIYLPKQLDLSIEVLAEETGLSKSQVCQEMIDYVLEDEDRLDEVFPEEGVLDQVEDLVESVRGFFKRRKEKRK